MKKPVKFNDLYDLHEILDYIEKKYDIPVYDFYGYRGYYEKWCDSQGLGQTDPEGKQRNASNIWYKAYSESPTGEISCPPMNDFWSYFFDVYQPQNSESFFFMVETREDWPSIMNDIMEIIKKDFGDEFDAFLSEA